MKPVKKDKSFLQEYVDWLYGLTDVNEIISIFDGGSIDISTDDYQFASIDEAKEHFNSRPIHSFKISSTKPSASVEFGRMFAKSYVASSPTSLQLYHELDEVMKRCQRKPATLYKYWAVFLAPQIPWATSFAWDPKVGGFPVLVGLQLILLSWMLWVIFISLRSHTVVILKRRDEAPSFFRRNRDFPRYSPDFSVNRRLRYTRVRQNQRARVSKRSRCKCPCRDTKMKSQSTRMPG